MDIRRVPLTFRLFSEALPAGGFLKLFVGLLACGLLCTESAGAQSTLASRPVEVAQEQKLSAAHDASVSGQRARVVPTVAEVPELGKSISLDLRGAPLEEAITSITDQTDLRVAYLREKISEDKTVTIEEGAISVKEALRRALEGTDLRIVRATERQLVLVDSASPSTSPERRQTGLAPQITQVEAQPLANDLTPIQQGTIAGTVTEASTGNPLPGVNVVIEGVQQGASTAPDGTYEITGVEAGTYTVRASFVGYADAVEENVQVEAEQTTTVNFELAEAAADLDEVVVVGYGEQRRRDLTGAVSSIGTEDFTPGVSSSPEQLFRGKVAGVQITEASGAPGAQTRVRIRGSSSINAGNSPLYVIDGMPIQNNPAPTANTQIASKPASNPLSTLNPGDIESVEVLKDASATAIYGARGANGVIIITTKDGQGDFNVQYQGYGGVQVVGDRKLDLLDAQEYVSVMNGIAEVEGSSPVFTQEDRSAIGAGTNWQERIFEQSVLQNHAVSFSRNIENTSYYASFNFYNQEGNIIGSELDRYSGRFNIEQETTENLTFQVNINASRTENQKAAQGFGTNETAGVLNSALEMDPTMPVRNDQGEFNRHPVITTDNPMAIAEGVTTSDESFRVIGNASLEYSILSSLSIEGNVGVDRQNHRSDSFNSPLTIQGEGAGGIANVISTESTDWVADLTVNYDEVVRGIHDVNVLAGVNFQKFNNRSQISEARSFPSPTVQTNNLGLGSQSTFGVGSNSVENTLLSGISRINYNLYDKYLATFTFRADGSSRFGEDKRFGYFPSFALGWRISEESFLEDVDFLSNLKVRGSWGITGNQSIGNFNFLQTFAEGGGTVIGDRVVSAVSPQRLPNPELKWETTKQTDIGIEFGLFGERLTGSVDYFRKNTEDLLLNLPISGTSGFSSVLRNVGSTKNTGWELTLSTINLRTDRLSWQTDANLSLLDNEVTSIGPRPSIIRGNGGNFIGNFALVEPGEPLNAYLGYVIDGVFQEGDDISNSAQPNAEPGYWRYEDLNGDGQITSEDRTVIGSPHPDATIGITNTFRYGRLDLSVLLRGVFGNQILNSQRVRTFHPIDSRRNRLSEPLLNRWTPENPSNKYPSGANLGVYANAANANIHTETVEDASFLRIQNVTLGYDVPVGSIGGLESARVYASGQNLLTFTDYSGYDPEVSAQGDSDILVDFNSYPIPRTFQLGVSLSY